MFANYFLHREEVLPKMPACLYEYVIAANGVFIRAERPGLAAMLVTAPAYSPIRGLAPAQPSFKLARLVPAWMLERMLLTAFHQGSKEILYYGQLTGEGWKITLPRQVQSAGGVAPVDPYASADVLLEVHSHHNMSSFFSATDDRDESSGFRIFAVLGHLNSQLPEIRVRVGIYGNFWQIPAAWVFEMPRFVVDALEGEREPVYMEVEDVA